MMLLFIYSTFLVAVVSGQNLSEGIATPSLTLTTPSDDLFGEIVTTTSTPPATTTTTVSTTTEPPPIINSGLPKPTGLSKTGASETTLRLRYNPPNDFLTDIRYTDFRVEYITLNNLNKQGSWEAIEIPKRSDANNLVLTNLLQGILYLVRMRSQARNNVGTLVLSSPTDSIFARTKPMKVTRLTVVRSPSHWSNATVSWNNPPLESIESSTFDEAVLTYYIEGLSSEQSLLFPKRNVSFKVKSVFNTNPRQSVTFPIVAGAPYRYEVVTYSGDRDRTKSDIVSISKIIEIPGPLYLLKTNYTETSMVVMWTPREDVASTTSYSITWSYEGSRAIMNATTTSSNYEITDLIAGGLYVVLVRSIQKDNLFGRISDASVFTARTKPRKPSDIVVIQRSDTALRLNFTTPSDDTIDEVIVTYQVTDDYSSENTARKSEGGTNEVLLENLQPAALYTIRVTVLSQLEAQTNNSETFFARTNPTLPRRFQVSSERATIFASWWAPPLYSSAQWSYKIDYYPKDDRKQNLSLCQVKGQDYHKIRLRDIDPGRGYVVAITTVAGKNCDRNSEGNYVTFSDTTQQTVYTQPGNPSIKYWAQVTLNWIRIAWNPPSDAEESRFENYVIEVKRIRGKASYVPFKKEEFTIIVGKDQGSYVLELDQGVDYRVEVTTVVGSSDEEQRSIVISGVNSVQFKTWHRYYEHLVFPRLDWKFTTCGRSGRDGPSQFLCDGEYSDTNLNNMVEVKNGIQHWIAPIDGLYRIVAAGAGYEGPGGFGATVSGLFHLKEGATIKIAVGQRGKRIGQRISAGGGGGTFVVASSLESQGVEEIDETEAMLIAGGAGSAAAGMPKSSIPNGRLNHNAGSGSEFGRTFGRGGIGDGNLATPGLPGVEGTGGGASYNGIAETPRIRNIITERAFPAVGFSPFQGKFGTLNVTEALEYIPLTGGKYANSDGTFSEGGFGGGGSGYLTGVGGGGGYSGGGGGPIGGYSGGGGSFIKFTGGIQLAELSNDQAGFVTVRLVGVPLVSPIPLTFYLVISFVAGILIALVCGSGLYGVSKCTDRYLKIDENAFILENSYLPTDVRPEPNTALVIGNPRPQEDLIVSESSSTSESAQEMEAAFSERVQDKDPVEDHCAPRGLSAGIGKSNDTNLRSDRDTDSLSSVSSVSSMATGLTDNKFEVDSKTGKLRYRGRKVSRMNSSFTGFESTDVETGREHDSSSSDSNSEYTSDDDSLPPSAPPAPELVSEEQKAEFRKKLSMFHEMTQRSRLTGIPSKTEPSFVPSTNL